jgi:hypothetical protein
MFFWAIRYGPAGKMTSKRPFEQEIGRGPPQRRTVAIALAVGMAVCAAEARGGEAAITCTNPASGATWQIRIDYDRGTVDSYPARISETTISWHDATDGGNYTLDRKSGKLTVVIASSTGGYFLYDRCRLEN